MCHPSKHHHPIISSSPPLISVPRFVSIITRRAPHAPRLSSLRSPVVGTSRSFGLLRSSIYVLGDLLDWPPTLQRFTYVCGGLLCPVHSLFSAVKSRRTRVFIVNGLGRLRVCTCVSPTKLYMSHSRSCSIITNCLSAPQAQSPSWCRGLVTHGQPASPWHRCCSFPICVAQPLLL